MHVVGASLSLQVFIRFVTDTCIGPEVNLHFAFFLKFALSASIQRSRHWHLVVYLLQFFFESSRRSVMWKLSHHPFYIEVDRELPAIAAKLVSQGLKHLAQGVDVLDWDRQLKLLGQTLPLA